MAKSKLMVLAVMALMVIGAHGKGVKAYSCIYSTAKERMELTSVERTDRATVLAFTYRGIPGETFSVPRELYLDDSKHRRYKLTGANGIALDETVRCPLTESITFHLAFEPLPQEERIFDVLPAFGHTRWFAFWGVHENTYRPKAYSQSKRQNGSGHGLSSTPGTVHISGVFIGKSPKSMQLYFSPIRNTVGETGNTVIQVNADGTFALEKRIDGTVWTYLDAGSFEIPVFLTPGDSLHLTVGDCDNVNRSVSYSSAQGYDPHESLMLADPLYTNSLRWTEPANTPILPSMANSLYGQMKEEEGKLKDYLAWKYRLTGFESRMLGSMMQAKQIEYLSERVLTTIQHVYPLTEFLGEENKKKIHEMVMRKEFTDCLAYLADVDMSDEILFVTPYHKAIQAISDLVQYAGGMMEFEERTNLIELYTRQQLGPAAKDAFRWTLTGK